MAQALRVRWLIYLRLRFPGSDCRCLSVGTYQILGRSKHAGHLQQMETGAWPVRNAYGRYRT
jgi:hypothetical protein